MNPNLDLQDMVCMRRERPQDHTKECENRMKKVRGLEKPVLVLAKSALEIGQQKK